MMIYSRGILIGLVFSVIVSCAPVRNWNPLDYSVRPGDTLYSIAWRYEMDFQEIARWNAIGPPYAIYPGQRLKLSADDASGSFGHASNQSTTGVSLSDSRPEIAAATIESSAEVTAIQSGTSVVVQKGDTLFSIAQRNGLHHTQLARWNALHSPYALTVGQTLRLTPPGDRYATTVLADAPKPSGTTTIKPPAQSVAMDKRPVAAPVVSKPFTWTAVSSWRWPVKGRVIKTFSTSDTTRKGIGIAGKTGQPVSAAANGRVVYSGNGLISYGNLIIIKHDNNFLSAYAYNEELLVAEGDDVRADQLIARMGEHNGRAQLHFEIRKNGKPVNPLQYLPQG